MPKWAILAAVGAVMVVAAITLLKSWPVINVVATGRTPEYPDIQPRQYSAGRDRVSDAVLRAVSRMPRWTLISSPSGQGDFRVEAKTMLLRFVDDVTIRIAEQGGATTVNVRSASRVGRGDFGQNARNIRAFLLELDRQMETGAGS